MQQNGNYDVIITGAGIAGLVLGDLLAKQGKKVLTLEQAAQVGGNMMGFRRKGFFFDAGDQSTESCGLLFPILSELGLYDPDDWDRADWRIVTPDADVRLKNYDQIRADFKKAYPGNDRDLDEWFDFLSTGCLAFRDLMAAGNFPLLYKGAAKYRNLLKMAGAASKFFPLLGDALTKTGTQKCLEIFKDKRLAFLFGEFGNANMLLFMFFSFWYCFVYDYWYPKGGLQSICDKVADDFRARGGELRLKTLVKKVVVKDRRAVGVETADGEQFFADKVVHAGNLKMLVQDMCPRELFPYKYRQTVKTAPVSFGMTSAYLGLDMPDSELHKTMQTHHTFYWRTYETVTDPFTPDAHRRGFSQLNWTSMHDKSLAPKGQNSMVIQVFTNYDWMNGWETGTEDPAARNKVYRELKKKVLDDIITDSQHVIPGLKDKVVFKELGTPRTMARYTLNERGAPMGWSYDLYQIFMARRFGSFTTPIENLYTCGHYSIWPGGVVFAALSAALVADAMYRGVPKTLLW